MLCMSVSVSSLVFSLQLTIEIQLLLLLLIYYYYYRVVFLLLSLRSSLLCQVEIVVFLLCYFLNCLCV
jgi:hypothetical protein